MRPGVHNILIPVSNHGVRQGRKRSKGAVGERKVGLDIKLYNCELYCRD